MGVKGKLAWSLKIDKVSKTLFQATYRELQNILMATVTYMVGYNRSVL